jgi:hypothetical protein
MACGSITIDNTAPAPTGFPIILLRIQDTVSLYFDDTIRSGRNYGIYIIYQSRYTESKRARVTCKFDGVIKYQFEDPTGIVPPGADRGCVVTLSVPGAELLSVSNVCITVEEI